MEAHRLRAPSSDGALLAEPPLAEAGARLATSAARLARWEHDFQGRSASRLRAIARQQIFEQARRYLGSFDIALPDRLDPGAPLVVTGHQAELFHPGVWIKNFAAAAIARAEGGTALNLVVDDDILKSSSIRVPQPTGGNGRLRVRRVEFDEWAGEVPFEELKVRDESLFATFAERVHGVLGGAVPDPVIDDFWPRAVALRDRTDRLGLRFALARRALEGSWGIHNLEVPLSTLCDTEAFHWFAAHLLAQLPRFQQIHNEALARYRRLYKIRSTHHPVPALGVDGEWREAPFWVWRAGPHPPSGHPLPGGEGMPRRRPLLVRQLSRSMQLRAWGDDAPFIELPLGPDREACCAVEQLQRLPARRVRLRTRALTTTMFARYVLGDLFIHGIGGAKYDELGDAIAGAFFGIEPPPYLALSLTLWLDLGTDPASPERLAAIERRLRDLTYNPDRNLRPAEPPSPTAQAAFDAKREAIARTPATRSERLSRFREIRRCNEALQQIVAPQRDALVQERTRLLAGLHRNALAHHREYAFVLHSEAHLRAAFARAVPLPPGG
jgi:hypothetical protein